MNKTNNWSKYEICKPNCCNNPQTSPKRKEYINIKKIYSNRCKPSWPGQCRKKKYVAKISDRLLECTRGVVLEPDALFTIRRLCNDISVQSHELRLLEEELRATSSARTYVLGLLKCANLNKGRDFNYWRPRVAPSHFQSQTNIWTIHNQASHSRDGSHRRMLDVWLIHPNFFRIFIFWSSAGFRRTL